MRVREAVDSCARGKQLIQELDDKRSVLTGNSGVRRVKMLHDISCPANNLQVFPEGPTTQCLRSVVSKTISFKGMVVGTRDLNTGYSDPQVLESENPFSKAIE